MRLEHALQIMRGEPINEFRVSYERVDGTIVHHGCFPNNAMRPSEPAFNSLDYAMSMAERFARAAPSNYRNIMVLGSDFARVEGTPIHRAHGYWAEKGV